MENSGSACRLCGSGLQGAQRRWLFHRAPPHADLRRALAQVLGQAPGRGDGRSEFLCGKCAQALGRLSRLDAVAAQVRALSIHHLRRLREEKERLTGCLRHLSTRCSPPTSPASGARSPLPAPFRAEHKGPGVTGSPCPSRRCGSCHGLRVSEVDYEWVCGTPRPLGAGSPALPLCRDKSQSLPLVLRAGAGGHRGSQLSLRSASLGSGSLLSLDGLGGLEPLAEVQRALQGIGWRALRVPPGSRIPVLARRGAPCWEPAELEDEFLLLGMQALGGQELPGAIAGLTGRLAAAEEELRSLRARPEAHECTPEPELGRLRGALRDKDRDLSRLAAALRRAEQTMHALRETLERKELARGQLAAFCAAAQAAWRWRDRARNRALRDKDELVTTLRAALASGTQDLERAARAPWDKDRGPQPGAEGMKQTL